MVHLLAGGSGPPSTVSRSVSPRMRSNTFSVEWQFKSLSASQHVILHHHIWPKSLLLLTDINIVSSTRLDPGTLELSCQLLAFLFANLPSNDRKKTRVRSLVTLGKTFRRASTHL